MMDAERFAALVAAYGAEPDRWPEGERAQALRFRLADPQAALPILDAERALDALLASAPAPEPQARLVSAILAQAPRRPSLAPAVSLAACALLGVTLGFAGFRGAAAEAEMEGALLQLHPDMELALLEGDG